MMTNERRWRRTLEGSLGIPATEGNQVDVLRDGITIFPAMLEAISSATRTVDLLTFVYWRGDIARRFAAALSERAASGVRCRVILDALGARHVEKELVERMQAAGVHVYWFRPLLDGDGLHHPGYRTHRKVLVCDEEVAFTGGIGIGEEWDGSSEDGTGWRETQLRVRGPAVDGLRAAFLDDWLDSGQALLDERDRFPEQPRDGETTAMVIRGASEQGRNDIAMLRQLLFEQAEKELRLTAPYFAPDAVVLDTLIGAAERGVRVQLLVPGVNNDKMVAQLATERHYQLLLDAGIEIHVFTPTMLHAKVITVDGVLAVVGSANLNHRSLRHDEEVDVVLFDARLVGELNAHTDADLARCRRITSDDLDTVDRAARGPLRVLTGLVTRWT